MAVKKSSWKKPSIILINIGKCRYCQKEMTNAESFVAFYDTDKTKAHYECMRKDDFKKIIENKKKTTE